MAKFDGIRMQDLVEVKDPDEEGGLTLVFKDNKFLKIKLVDGKLYPSQFQNNYFLVNIWNLCIISSCEND